MRTSSSWSCARVKCSASAGSRASTTSAPTNIGSGTPSCPRTAPTATRSSTSTEPSRALEDVETRSPARSALVAGPLDFEDAARRSGVAGLTVQDALEDRGEIGRRGDLHLTDALGLEGADRLIEFFPEVGFRSAVGLRAHTLQPPVDFVLVTEDGGQPLHRRIVPFGSRARNGTSVIGAASRVRDGTPSRHRRLVTDAEARARRQVPETRKHVFAGVTVHE